MKVGFIGAGKVGFSLGRYFADNGIELSGYYSRTADSARKAAEFTGSEFYSQPDGLISASDAVFLTVPDGAIKETYLSLTKYKLTGKQLCHCSGAMSATEAFPDISAYGALASSIHPLFPVSSKEESYKELGNAFFCIEGDCADEWSGILSRMGNSVRIITSGIKSRYHAACSVASNLVCGLVGTAADMLISCGFKPEDAEKALKGLFLDNAKGISERGPVAQLTGPVERNDTETVRKHLASLTPEEKKLYISASLSAVKLAEKKHPDRDYEELKEILEDHS